MSASICLIQGDGIGPEITQATQMVLQRLAPDLDIVHAQAGLSALEQHGTLLPEETLQRIAGADATLKGPLTTPVGEGFSSINVALRRHFDLYANVRPVRSVPGTRVRYQGLDIITVRENTEGAYLNEGQFLSDDGQRAESRIVITRKGSERAIRHAFELARAQGRQKVTLVHKANILKTTSGLFLKCGREIAEHYPDIQFEEMIVDNACMQLVLNPERFDVIVTTNLFGDILSDLCAGLVGGLGMAPGANIGQQAAIFEAVHGSAPDIAGQGIANPAALMLAASMMLDHLGRTPCANQLRQAIHATIRQGDRITPDLGGSGTTLDFTQAVLDRIPMGQDAKPQPLPRMA